VYHDKTSALRRKGGQIVGESRRKTDIAHGMTAVFDNYCIRIHSPCS
jgi:hypothetical protein